MVETSQNQVTTQLKSIGISHDVRNAVVAALKEGKHYKDIAAEFNVNPKTVLTWQRRAGILTPLSPEAKQLEEAVSSASAEVHNRLAKAALIATEGMDKEKPPRSLKTRIERLKQLDQAVQVAKPLFNWGEHGSTVINIALLESAQVRQLNPAQPIDVEQVKPEEPS